MDQEKMDVTAQKQTTETLMGSLYCFLNYTYVCEIENPNSLR
ncbi:hypothetical protein ACFOW1_08265 [Parasediminibacterium paludis]|uniref:Uncharacterized protein n=1 Tax=Parasediminibacterium paludis TaxID=908966 RepID=A0ABV8PV75_9BACT